eukprot:m.1137972 g.1137972  ORF g.1137972 m.1137972 type:complete len:55 (+) comp24437_c1_seq12:838-1002(+)
MLPKVCEQCHTWIRVVLSHLVPIDPKLQKISGLHIAQLSVSLLANYILDVENAV